MARPNYYAIATPLDSDLMAKVNLTTGVRGASFGLLKEGKVTWWPLLLLRPVFADDRQQLDQLVARAVQAAAAKQVDAPGIEELLDRLNRLGKKLEQTISTPEGDSWTPTKYADAKTFLKQFSDAVKVLQYPDAVNFVTGRYVPQGKTVGELVQYMKENGLSFAAATPGTERAYTALHRALKIPQ
jgi:hypothetical protein